MASAEPTLFSYEILGLVGREGAGPHDLLRMAMRGRMLAWSGESQYYTEPKRIVTGFLRQLVELHLDLIDEVEQELQGESVTAPPHSTDGPS